ncbi:MAG: hypothetical protein DMF60_19360 [Acidobacteria bacterium]|nr:MAG: hypothetical protein DMF60_19360 [Acidobacteriota bacterium]
MILRKHTARLLFKVGLLSLSLLGNSAVDFLTSTALGQDQIHPIESRLQASADSHAIGFTVPEGYMRSDLPKLGQHRYKGIMILDPDSPAGMFIILLGEGQTVDELEADVESTIKGMFIHTPDESGKLVMGLSQVEDIQIAVYRRTVRRVPLVYGYFAARDNTGTMKELNGKFLDGTGSGVKVFDTLWRSIGEVK